VFWSNFPTFHNQLFGRMKKFLQFLLIALPLGCTHPAAKKQADQEAQTGPITLVIHGGAGAIKRENMTPEKERAYLEKLTEVLDSGYAVLDRGVKVWMLL
jgi:L-asparaginase / beta-aspartyl-peptidase